MAFISLSDFAGESVRNFLLGKYSAVAVFLETVPCGPLIQIEVVESVYKGSDVRLKV